MVGYGLLVAAALICAWQAVRSRRLLTSAICLAGVSAILALIFYLVGAVYLAVFELSIGAGLVTVLFVFAISVAGEELAPIGGTVPRPLAWALILVSVGLLGWLFLPLGETGAVTDRAAESLTTVLWHRRGLDLVIQVVQIFSGVLGIMGLLSESKAPLRYPVAEEISQRRALELNTLLQRSVEQEER